MGLVAVRWGEIRPESTEVTPLVVKSAFDCGGQP